MILVCFLETWRRISPKASDLHDEDCESWQWPSLQVHDLVNRQLASHGGTAVDGNDLRWRSLGNVKIVRECSLSLEGQLEVQVGFFHEFRGYYSFGCK